MQLRTAPRGPQPDWTRPRPAPLTDEVKLRALDVIKDAMRSHSDGWIGVLHHGDGRITCHGGRRGQKGALNEASKARQALPADERQTCRILLGRSCGWTEVCCAAGRPYALR